MDEKLREYVETVECETPEQTRVLEHARLDMIYHEAWRLVEREGSLEAIDLALRITDLRIRLFELDRLGSGGGDNDTEEHDK